MKNDLQFLGEQLIEMKLYFAEARADLISQGYNEVHLMKIRDENGRFILMDTVIAMANLSAAIATLKAYTP